jgi:acyl-CoA dehydrogenase
VPTSTYESPWVTEELAAFRDAARRFIAAEFTPVQQQWREQRAPTRDAWTKAGEAGLLLCDVPECYGGGGGTFAYEAVVLEELARAGVHFGTREHSIVAHYILDYGTDEQKERWLPRMASGELVGAIAMTEPATGSDLQRLTTSARRGDACFVINGTKTFITNGLLAGIVCVALKTDPKAVGPTGISLVAVETSDLPGYRVGKPLEKIGVHGQDTCELFFDDARVPASNLIGAVEGKGFFQMMEQLPWERLAIAVAALATAEAAVAMTAEYVKARTAFGQSLIEFQNTRFKLAECKTLTHVGRVFVDNCVQRFTDGELDAVTAAMAKYWLTDCECRVVDACLQLYGGYGYMVEYPIARMWTDSRMHPIGGGTNEIMKEMIGWSI